MLQIVTCLVEKFIIATCQLEGLYLRLISCDMFWHVQAEDRPHQCAEYIGKAARVLIRLQR